MLAKTSPTLPDHNAPISLRELIGYAWLEEQARTLATQALPRAGQTTPSKAEAMVIELIAGRIAARNDEREAEARRIQDQIGDLPNPKTDRNLSHLDSHVTNELMTVFHTRAPVIRTTVAAERQSQAELNAFRDKYRSHLGNRDAVYPLSRLNHFALVGLVLMLEGTANMVMFLDAVATGLLGALITAIAIAAANIALAIFAGLVPLRFLNVPDLEE